MVYSLNVYEFVKTFIPDYDAEPGLAAYKLAKGYVLAWVYEGYIALCAEEPDVMSKRMAKERGMDLAERRGVRWLG